METKGARTEKKAESSGFGRGFLGGYALVKEALSTKREGEKNRKGKPERKGS